jgi:cytoskeletal protein RodZ
MGHRRQGNRKNKRMLLTSLILWAILGLIAAFLYYVHQVEPRRLQKTFYFDDGRVVNMSYRFLR